MLPLLAAAQNGLNLQFMPNAPAGQFYQPALLAEMEMDAFRLSGHGAAWYNSSSVSFATIQGISNFLTEDFKQTLIADLTDGNRFELGLRYGQMLNFKTGKLKWGLSWRDRWEMGAAFDNPNTMGLLLRGNAPYAGQTVADEAVSGKLSNFWEIGVSLAFSIKENLHVGIRPKLLLGRQYVSLENLDYSLFTAPLGTQLTVDGSYDAMYDLSEAGWTDQLGYGVDVGIVFDPTEKWRIQLAALDIGQSSWEVDRFNGDLAFDYEGVNLLYLFGPDGEDPAFFITDTLRTLLSPDSSREEITVALPSQFSAAVTRRVGANGKAILSAHFSPAQSILLTNVAYHHQITRWWMLGANAYLGGNDGFGFGAITMFQVIKEDQLYFNFGVGSENLSGVVLPTQGQGAGLHVGESLGF